MRGKALLANKDDRIDADGMSERLRFGDLKPVFHGAPEILTLKELVRNYNNLVEDSTRVMLRIKAIYRWRAIATPGVSVYHWRAYCNSHYVKSKVSYAEAATRSSYRLYQS